jgi:hypothetical protein
VSEGDRTQPKSIEREWRTFKEVREKALARFYDRTLAEFSKVIDPASGVSGRDRYHRLYKLVRKRDRELANAFDDFRRSTYFQQLTIMCSMNLVTDEELARFHPQTQKSVKMLLGDSEDEEEDAEDDENDEEQEGDE